MATSTLLLFSTLITIFTLSASARPCKTIFFITSSSSYHLQKPNFQSPRLTFLITQIRTRSLPRPMLFHTSSSVITSIGERTMDVMSISGAVLFGVGCGALTAATMYLIWSLFAPRRFDFGSDSEGSSDEENEGRPTKTVPPSADEVDQGAVMKM